MAVNSDEAARCLEIAGEAVAAGDYGKALRFIEKSKRMHPSEEAEALLQEVHRKQSGQGASSSGVGPSPQQSERGPAGMSGAPHLRSRQHPAAGSATALPAVDAGTVEQRKLVREVVAKHDYYDMLGCEKGASEGELKRGYRKLALRLHPDKNKARGADEAFKAVSRAYSCLSAPNERAHYDRYGQEDSQMSQRSGGGGPAAGGFQQGFDPDELFNMFFGTGFPAAARTHFHTNMRPGDFSQAQQRAGGRGQAQAQAAASNPLMQLVGLLPVVLLLFFTFFGSQADPAFALENRDVFHTAMETQRYHVPFWVKEGFERTYPRGSGARIRLEQVVEHDYKERLEKRCYAERVQQQQAARWGQREKARGMPLPHCNEIYERFGYRYSTYAF